MSRMFPVLQERKRGVPEGGVLAVPWTMVEPHARQAELNHGGQTLERLAERGGLSPGELVAVLEDRRWRRMGDAEAETALRAKLAAHATGGEVFAGLPSGVELGMTVSAKRAQLPEGEFYEVTVTGMGFSCVGTSRRKPAAFAYALEAYMTRLTEAQDGG